jgi:hypothetical protein
MHIAYNSEISSLIVQVTEIQESLRIYEVNTEVQLRNKFDHSIKYRLAT